LLLSIPKNISESYPIVYAVGYTILSGILLSEINDNNFPDSVIPKVIGIFSLSFSPINIFVKYKNNSLYPSKRIALSYEDILGIIIL